MMRPSRELLGIYLCVQPVDFRCSINGLTQLIQNSLGLDPFAQTLYVFINRTRDKIKIVYWERNGFCLWYKRLEQERFKWPSHVTTETVTLDGETLNWLLDGFDVWRHPPHKSLFFSSV